MDLRADSTSQFGLLKFDLNLIVYQINGDVHRPKVSLGSFFYMNRTTNNEPTLSLKQQFKLWLEQEQKDDEMIAFATIPHILRRFDRRLAIIKGNQLEKRYLREWRKLFRIDKDNLHRSVHFLSE